MNSYYVDTCIYLNLWKKEVDDSGNQLWEHAKDFFERAESEEAIIYYSGFLLKEFLFLLSTEEYLQKRDMFDSSPNFKKVILSKEEFELAGKISKANKQLSFYDVIHMLLAKKTNSTLVTRDKLLISLAKDYSVTAKRPEEL
jgi:predicted nucleic acid-binding protein